MSGIQKTCLFHLSIAVAAAVTFFSIRGLVHDPEFAHAAWLWMVLYALSDRVRNNVPLDEREQMILLQAAFVGFVAFWLVVVFATIATAVLQPGGSISISTLSLIPMVGQLFIAVTQSSVGLWLNARG